MKIKKFKTFESTIVWNDFIDKINKGIITKDINIDIKHLDILIGLIPKRSKMLDISIGDGVYSEYFIKNGLDVYGTDISDLAISTMIDKYPNYTWLVHDTLDKFPFDNNFFNLIFARLSLHYFDIIDIKKIFYNINLILSNGGYFYILVKTSNTGNTTTGKISYSKDIWLDAISSHFNLVSYWEEVKKAYSFENEESSLLHIIAKKN